MIVPGGGGSKLARAVRTSVVRERVEKPLADAVALRIDAHADELDQQRRIGAPELAAKHASEDIAGEAAPVGRRELCVQRRCAQRRGQSPLDVRAARASLDRRIDRDDRIEIARCERTNGNVCFGNAVHDVSAG
jgi:hypothetical protein